ncbi:MAG: M20/M25/M40 family metallo-hydrolase [Planctomycetes bacterium]|nr:M20/M25/M40 family metallo-hydrolase [Planctomycetota bacterium]
MKPVELLARMVRVPSVSGEEARLAGELARFVENSGHRAVRSGDNLWASRGAGRRVLLLNSHLDTVPPAPGWETDPYEPRIAEGSIIGLGSHDAKGSVAAQLLAFLSVTESDLADGRLLWTATAREETGGGGFEALVRELPPADAGVVGEPTGLVPASCQRGLLRLRMRALGKAAHASRPHQGENAVHKAARAILALEELDLGPAHPLLGKATAQATLVQGGTAANVLPAECAVTIDARTTPAVPNDELLSRIRGIPGVEFEVVSSRFVPLETDPRERIVQAALAATGAWAPIGFLGVSDRRWLGATPSVILGPGDGTWSHKAGERLPIAELERAVEVYRRLVRNYFQGG